SYSWTLAWTRGGSQAEAEELTVNDHSSTIPTTAALIRADRSSQGGEHDPCRTPSTVPAALAPWAAQGRRRARDGGARRRRPRRMRLRDRRRPGGADLLELGVGHRGGGRAVEPAEP